MYRESFKANLSCIFFIVRSIVSWCECWASRYPFAYWYHLPSFAEIHSSFKRSRCFYFISRRHVLPVFSSSLRGGEILRATLYAEYSRPPRNLRIKDLFVRHDYAAPRKTFLPLPSRFHLNALQISEFSWRSVRLFMIYAVSWKNTRTFVR